VKIAICGTHCAGKSTLVVLLSKELSIPIIKEVAGNYTEKERKNLETQLHILNDQTNAESKNTDFISDRSVIDNLAYIWFHSEKNKMPRVYKEASEFVDLYIETKKPYDLIIFVEEYFPLVDNGIRNLDVNQQADIYKFLIENAQKMCEKHNIPFLKIKGNTKKRIKVIKEWLTQHQQ
jgi:nicotinamide riboside kinase